MLRMVALDSLPAAEAHIDRAPGSEKRRQRSHVGRRRSAAPEASCEPRISGLIDHPSRTRGVELFGHEREGLVPGYRDKARIFIAPLSSVGPLHRVEHAMRIVELLCQAE